MSTQLSTTTDVDHFTRAVSGRLDGSPIAVMLDIDGTLSAIAPRPQDAIVPAPTRKLLRRLAIAPGTTLAVVSGRSAQDAWDEPSHRRRSAARATRVASRSLSEPTPRPFHVSTVTTKAPLSV